jgi:hypothetical protein
MRQLILALISFACAISLLSTNYMNFHKENNPKKVLELLQCIEKMHKIQKTKEQYQRLMITNLMDRLKNEHMYNSRLR